MHFPSGWNSDAHELHDARGRGGAVADLLPQQCPSTLDPTMGYDSWEFAFGTAVGAVSCRKILNNQRADVSPLQTANSRGTEAGGPQWGMWWNAADWNWMRTEVWGIRSATYNRTDCGAGREIRRMPWRRDPQGPRTKLSTDGQLRRRSDPANPGRSS